MYQRNNLTTYSVGVRSSRRDRRDRSSNSRSVSRNLNSLQRLPSSGVVMCVTDQEWAAKALADLLARLVRLLNEGIKL